MQQILSVWSSLSPRRRVIVVLATLAMFAAVLGLSRMASRPSMALLYAGLDAGAAGEVVQSLEASGVTYEIRGGAIFVDAARRDELRLTLAADGLPAQSSQGYELLDNLSGFGTTSQMFDAAYWRAKEGELARTIMATPAIRTARVHLGNPSGNVFARAARPTASVTITTQEGTLSAVHARALKYLVASAVAGMSPEDVSVIDARGGLVISGDDTASPAGDTGDRAQALKRNVERLLEARVGYGNAIVELSLETETDREQIRERKFDPNGRVAISSETEERTSSANDSGNNAVTVASNLPDGDAGSGSDSASQDSQTRERVNYEVSETTRDIERAPGSVKRLSVAVLLDGIRTVDPTSGEEVWAVRPDAEIAILRELVASAIGFDEARGDQLTIKSMQFEPLLEAGSTAAPGFLSRLHLDVMSLIQLAVLALVSLVLGLFVLRPILARASPAALDAPAPSAPAGLPAPITDSGPIPIPEPPVGLTGDLDDGEFNAPQMGFVSDFDFGDDDTPGFSQDPVARLKRLIEDRQEETVEILRSWMDEPEESA